MGGTPPSAPAPEKAPENNFPEALSTPNNWPGDEGSEGYNY